MDKTDKAILNLLQEDARMSFSEIARRIGVSSPTVTERVRIMETDGIIEGYHVKLNYEKLGFPLKVLVRIRVPHKDETKFIEFIRQQPEVLECYDLLGEDTFSLEVIASSVEQLDLFIKQKLYRYGQTTSHIILRQYSQSKD